LASFDGLIEERFFMKTRIFGTAYLWLIFGLAAAVAQQYPPPDYRQPGPDQPVQPRTPQLERRPTAPPSGKQYPAERQPSPQPRQPEYQPQQPQYQPQQPQPHGQQPGQPQQPPSHQSPPQQPQQPPQPQEPFRLAPQEQARVDRVLYQWEQRNEKIKTFDCRFKRWIYDVVFGPRDEPRFVEMGVIKFAAPDKGLFRLETMEKDGREAPIDATQAEDWICDGKSIFRRDPAQRKVVEYKLPPELHGKAIANSPLPFLFGAEAQTLKQRYFVRIITPPDAKDQVWLEAYPRYQEDAANFHHAQFIVTMPDMTPFALRLVEPNGKNYTVYQFYDIVVNDPLKFFKGDPFRPFVPQGWQLVVDNPQPAQAQRPPADGRR